MSEKEYLAYAMNGEAEQIKAICRLVVDAGVADWNAKLLHDLTAVYLDTRKKWENASASNGDGDEHDDKIRERTESEFLIGAEETEKEEKEKRRLREIREQDEYER